MTFEERNVLTREVDILSKTALRWSDPTLAAQLGTIATSRYTDAPEGGEERLSDLMEQFTIGELRRIDEAEQTKTAWLQPRP